MGNSLASFNVEQTPEEYIIRCKRGEFQIYMEDYIANQMRQARAAEDRGLVDK